MMKPGFLFFICLLLLPHLPLSPASADSTTHRISDYLQRAERFGFSGSVLIVRKGKVVLHRGYGLANRSTGAPVTVDTPFNLASLTKQFTATAILRLEQEGKLKTTDPIHRYLPGIPSDKRSITIQHLLNHTSGLARRVTEGRRLLTRAEFLQAILTYPQESPPGERYDYSNNGYALLAAIIENVSEKSYEGYLRKHLFQPAGMRRTGCDTERGGLADAKRSHAYNGDLDQGDAFLSHQRRSWEERGGTGIISTTRDLYRWERALRGNAILSAQQKRKLYASNPENYAGGWTIRESPWGRIAWHDGMLLPEGWNAQYWRFLEEDSCIIVLSNAYRGAPLAEAVGRTLKSLLTGMGGVLPPKVIPLTPGSRYVGEYTLPDGGRVRLSLQWGQLFVIPQNQAGADLLTGATPNQRKRHKTINQNTAAILEAMRQPEGEFLKALLPDAVERERAQKTLSRNWADLTRRFGAYQNGLVLNSISEGDFAETFARLHFVKGQTTVRFYWEDARFAGMSDEGALLGATPAVPVLPGALPLVRTGPREFATFDLATTTSIRFRFDGKQRLMAQPNLILPEPGRGGNVVFRLRGYPTARLVTVAGTFNDWQAKAVRLVPLGKAWVCRLPLPPGKYSYKFVVDGVWMLDPDNPTREDDGSGTMNSVRNVR